MSNKAFIWVGATLGSYLGGYIPTLFGQDFFSGWSLLGSAIGGITGIYAGYKLADYFSL